ncbi:MAG: long-chain fatty acid--CoA ligase [Gammaproteobacteria bacterium]|nr:long-chain fatty acid--CoA ligase [Gammaproteobacteria bacterium]
MNSAIEENANLTLPGLFKQRVDKSPDRIAYRYFNNEQQVWASSTWSEMSNEVARWQAALKKEPLQHGDKIAIMLSNSREWIMVEQAALGLGLVVIPLYTNDRVDNVAYILQDAGVKLLVVEGQEHLLQLQPIHSQLDGLVRLLAVNSYESDFQYTRLIKVQDWLPEQAIGLCNEIKDPNSLATIVYTSGTTGRPKGVMLSHKNILSNAFGGVDCVPVFEDDVFLSFLPLSHMFERTLGYYIPMLTGSTIAFARSVNQLAEDMLTIRPTVLISVPRIYERIHTKIQSQLENKSGLANRLFASCVNIGWNHFEYKQKRLAWQVSFLLLPLLEQLVGKKIMAKMGGRMRVAICGGAPLSPDIAKTFIGLGLNLIQGYGLTETSPIIAGNRAHDNIPASVGAPLKGFKVKVSDEGELLTKGDSIMLGYWNNPEATKAIIDKEGWLHTGDKVHIDEKKHIYITGRLKEIIVLANGEKIPPSDMEVAIAADPFFDQALIIGEGRPFLSAFVVLNEDIWETLSKKLDLAGNDDDPLQACSLIDCVMDKIKNQLSHFPGYAKIYRVSVFLQPWSIEDGLMTPTLKLKRDRIIAKFQNKVDMMYHGH